MIPAYSPRTGGTWPSMDEDDRFTLYVAGMLGTVLIMIFAEDRRWHLVVAGLRWLLLVEGALLVAYWLFVVSQAFRRPSGRHRKNITPMIPEDDKESLS